MLLQDQPNVSRETFALFEKYIEHILIWNKKINLLSRKSLTREFLEGQILDCLQLLDVLGNEGGVVVDVGSGSGLR